MRIVHSIAEMQRLAQRWRRLGARVGFVPTMGYLHDGHVSLMKRARRDVGSRGVVVVSVYVNPTQFAPHEDLSRYPRDLVGDCARCRSAGVDVVFAPSDKDMYPAQRGDRFSTFVVEETLSRSMEGQSRPSHFRGVTTVVAKLFNLVRPDIAVFGAKDFQQVAIVRRMVRDLNFPIEIVVAPTVREGDGLAMSSRNKRLSPEERIQAAALSAAIAHARERTRRRGAVSAKVLRRRLCAFIEQHPSCRVDYLEFFDSRSFTPVRTVRAGVQMALAVYVGATRLIDNARL